MIPITAACCRYKQPGATALFVVIFASFLFVAVTVGFTVLMLTDQNRSLDNELSQSARDAAQAGIEDAKRVLVQYQNCQQSGQASSSACARIISAVNAQQCNTISRALGDGRANPEVPIQKTEADQQLTQAYTCVKVRPDTASYEGHLKDEGSMRVVPLQMVSDADSVRISWVKHDDKNKQRISPSYNARGYNASQFYSPENPLKLPAKSQWNSYGSVLRVGAIQHNANGALKLSQLDADARTVFLYPITSGPASAPSGTIELGQVGETPPADMHKPIGTDPASLEFSETDTGNAPQAVRCQGTGTDPSQHRCQITLRLPHAITQDTKTYLTLAAMYRPTDFKIELLKDGQPVQFKNVQPEIDVTARANDVFRRLVARVEAADTTLAPYPRAALGTRGSVCKAFVITDSAEEFDSHTLSEHCPDVRNPNE